MHCFKLDLIEEHSSLADRHCTLKCIKSESIVISKSRFCDFLKLNGRWFRKKRYLGYVSQGVSSSIIELDDLNFTGVIPHAFKGKLGSPHPPLSLDLKESYYKGKGLGRGIPTNVGHASIFVGDMDAHWQ
jgi:hypothetical protein